MTISVLIPAHNEGAVLHECLAAIRGQTIPVDQIVVVADACTDNTVEVARSFGCDVIETNEQAKAASQDAGLAYVTGEYLVCVDADTVLAPDVVEKFMAELDHVDATCANMLPMPQQRGFWVANRRFAYALGRYWWRWCQAEIGRLMVLSGCAYALKTETVRSIGGFPGQLITCDMDLTWSLYGAGYKTSFCHGALAYTYDPETFSVYTKQMRRWAAGFFQNFQSHKGQVVTSPSAALVVGTLSVRSGHVAGRLPGWPMVRAPPWPGAGTLDVGGSERRGSLRDLYDRRDPDNQLETGRHRVPLLLARQLAEQVDLPLDTGARVDSGTALPVVDGSARPSDRHLSDDDGP